MNHFPKSAKKAPAGAFFGTAGAPPKKWGAIATDYRGAAPEAGGETAVSARAGITRPLKPHS